jgi:single-strand DNA-binding protein
MKAQKHLEGEIIKMDGPVSVGANGLQKTIMVIDTGGEYPQTIPVEWLKDKATSVATQYALGDEVRIGYNLRGREYNGKYYSSVQGWEIELTGAGTGKAAGDGGKSDRVEADPPGFDNGVVEDDQLAF